MHESRRTSRRIAAAAVAVLALAGCGGGDGVDATKSDQDGAATSATAATVAATEVVTTEATTTTTAAPTTTEAPTTTAAPTTTEAPTTTVAGIASGWFESEFNDQVFPPCCASNWYGYPSPAAPADPAAPLADGLYRMIVSEPWDPATPNELQIEVHRFEQCSLLPAGSCELQDSYTAEELGYEEAPIRTMTLPLDATTMPGVVGWAGCGGTPRFGNGADLAALIAAYDAAYQSVIWPRIAGGEDPTAVLTDLAANPAGGFGPPADPDGMCSSGYEIVFDPGTGAPPLLLQTVVSWTSDFDTSTYVPLAPMEELLPTVLEVYEGVLRPYFYAGFYS